MRSKRTPFADAICCVHELPTYRGKAKMNCTLCTTDIHSNGRSILWIKFVMCEQQTRANSSHETIRHIYSKDCGIGGRNVRKAERGYNTGTICSEEARHKKSWEETSGCEVSPKWPAKIKTEAARCKIGEFITKPHAKHTLLFFPLIPDARWQSLSRGHWR